MKFSDIETQMQKVAALEKRLAQLETKSSTVVAAKE